MINVKRPVFKDKSYNVLDFGASPTLGFNNKDAFQKAIDTCSNSGGGTVIVPQGLYYTGPIELKSNVNFFVDTDAYIKFTKSKEEYPLIWTEYEGARRIRALSPISAKGATNIAITGKGVIDGSGDLWRGIKKFKLTEKQWQKCLKKSEYVIHTNETDIWCPTKTYYDGVMEGEPDYNLENVLEIASKNYDLYRPVFVSLIECDKVLIEDITLMNSPAWNLHPLYCTNLTINRAIIKNKFSAQNGDGLDLESCQSCEIADTIFEVGDDGICLKAGKNREARKRIFPTKDVWIHGCKVFDAHGGIVVGSEMSRGINNVLVENCSFSGTDIGIRFKSAMGRGGVVENITIRNISMIDIVEEAMIFTLGYVLKSIEDTNEKTSYLEDDIPEFRNIYVDNVSCSNSKIALKINGLTEKPVNNLVISNSKIVADKALDCARSKNIKLENVEIITPDKTFMLNEIFDEKKL